MTIATDFKGYLEGILTDNGIVKAEPQTNELRRIREYEHAKCVLPANLSTDEYQRAVKLAAAWCGV